MWFGLLLLTTVNNSVHFGDALYNDQFEYEYNLRDRVQWKESLAKIN